MTLRVLVISHSCIVDVNQTLFVELGRQADLELGLVVPARFNTSLRGQLTFVPHPELQARIYQTQPGWEAVLSRLGDKAFHLWWYPEADRIVEEFKPDIVHIDEEPYSLTAWQFARAAKRRGARVTFYTKQNLSKRFPWPFDRLERAVYQMTDAAVALTDEVAAVLRAKGFQGPIQVIPHAVDLRVFQPRPVPELRAALGSQPVTVGYLGRLTRAKGVFDLVQALACLRAQGAEVGGVFIGRGADEAELQATVQSLGLAEHVRFVPAVPHNQVADYYNALDIVAVPSRTMPNWKEQFGRVIIEANACGVPVLGSSSGSVPELVQATGGGVIFPEGDVPQLTRHLGALIDQPDYRQQLARRGQQSVAERYTYAAIAAQFRAVFQSLIKF